VRERPSAALNPSERRHFHLTSLFQADSEWRLYFDFLPRDFQTPLQWSDAELQLLQARHAVARKRKRAADLRACVQGTPLHERVAFECDSLRQFYHQVHAAACAPCHEPPPM
jgi:hypothetical protein